MKTHQWNGLTLEIHPAEEFLEDGTPTCIGCAFMFGTHCPGLDRTDEVYPCTLENIVFKKAP